MCPYRTFLGKSRGDRRNAPAYAFCVKILPVRFAISGSNSAVECQLPKLDVAGSIPVSRSTHFNHFTESARLAGSRTAPLMESNGAKVHY